MLVSLAFRRRDNKLQLKRRAERQKEVNKPLSAINHGISQRAAAVDSEIERNRERGERIRVNSFRSTLGTCGSYHIFYDPRLNQVGTPILGNLFHGH